MRGIVLAGGSGTRLHPVTKTVSKQLLPVYDKPMIYYPLTTLIELAVQEVLFICTPRDLESFRSLLGDGSHLGMRFEYAVQNHPNGLAEALIIGQEFLQGDDAALVLGDNLFFGVDLEAVRNEFEEHKGAHVLAYKVADPRAYGVVEIDDEGRAISLEEKPKSPKSEYAVPGLYLFDSKASNYASAVRPSPRGELEITDLLATYMRNGSLRVTRLPRGVAWLDTGTVESLNDAAQFVRALELRQNIKIGSPEEAAWKMQLISTAQLHKLADELIKSGYGSYLKRISK
jgi:glucose-1-phosphate thymidylyltransferase